MGEEITQKKTIWGIASLICGLISLILIFIPRGSIPSTATLLYFITNFVFATLSIGLGVYSFRIQKLKDGNGIVGMVLGLSAVIIVILQYWILYLLKS